MLDFELFLCNFIQSDIITVEYILILKFMVSTYSKVPSPYFNKISVAVERKLIRKFH